MNLNIVIIYKVCVVCFGVIVVEITSILIIILTTTTTTIIIITTTTTGQIGNPDGNDKPNKKYYDPRMSLRAGEEGKCS